MSDRVPRRGSLTVGLDLRYDADVRYRRHDAVEEGDAFASLPAIQDAIRDGDYDIENPARHGPRPPGGGPQHRDPAEP